MGIQPQEPLKVLLIGDKCDDVYHYGVCERMSPEAPVPVFRETSTVTKPGMSSNVRLNLESFGLKVSHLSNFEKISKHRFVEQNHNQQIFRCDVGEKSRLLPARTQDMEAAFERIASNEFDAIIVSDYDKGFVDDSAEIREFFQRVPSAIPVFVDSKKSDLRMFGEAIIKINESEFSRALISPDQEAIVTLGKHGATWRGQTFTTNTVDVYDVCGAGDVFLAGLVYGFLKTRDLASSIKVANKCASHSVTKMGTYILTEDDINDLCI
jgi:bifunctional ADP-heptose synthase (sugar kinase/adenylyltransferase)